MTRLPTTTIGRPRCYRAVAVYDDVENLNATNSPIPSAKPPTRLEAFAPMVGLLFIVLIAIVYFYIRFMPYMDDENDYPDTTQ